MRSGEVYGDPYAALENLPPMEDGSDWRDHALCAQVEAEAFFPDSHSYSVAKRICGMCDVRFECLQFALLNDIRFGIWGATSPNERDRLQGRTAS